MDDSRFTHECGVIFFGTEAELIVPLARLNDDQRRQEILALIQSPPRMGWTDQVNALKAAMDQLDNASEQPALVLLTDGKPEWSSQPTLQEQKAYIQELKRIGKELADAEVPISIILLANEATDSDPDIANIWQPLWEEMANATLPGRFYIARQAEDLVDIYHDIVVALTGSRTAGPIIQATVGAGGLRETIPVEANLSRLTLVESQQEQHQPQRHRLRAGRLAGGRGCGQRAARRAGWCYKGGSMGD